MSVAIVVSVGVLLGRLIGQLLPDRLTGPTAMVVAW